LAPVAEEEVVAVDLVALDQVVDVVVIGVDADANALGRVAHGAVELYARLGLEVGIARDEAAARRSAVVAVREHRVAESARDLPRERQALERTGTRGYEARERRVRSRAVAEVAAEVARR